MSFNIRFSLEESAAGDVNTQADTLFIQGKWYGCEVVVTEGARQLSQVGMHNGGMSGAKKGVRDQKVCVATAQQLCMEWHRAGMRVVCLQEELASESCLQKYVFLLSPECACSLAVNYTAQVEHLWHLYFPHLWNSPSGFMILAECCGSGRWWFQSRTCLWSLGPIPWGARFGGHCGLEAALMREPVQRAGCGAGCASGACAARQEGCSAWFAGVFPRYVLYP